MDWLVNLLNLLLRDGLSRLVKFLAHHKMSRVRFTHFQSSS